MPDTASLRKVAGITSHDTLEARGTCLGCCCFFLTTPEAPINNLSSTPINSACSSTRCQVQQAVPNNEVSVRDRIIYTRTDDWCLLSGIVNTKFFFFFLYVHQVPPGQSPHNIWSFVINKYQVRNSFYSFLSYL